MLSIGDLRGGIAERVRGALGVLGAAAARRVWVVGFSGGKDSSVVVDLVVRFLRSCGRCPERVIVVYSDTLLDPPVVRGYALGVLGALRRLASVEGLPLEPVSAEPLPGEDLAYMVVARGYPAPSQRFRWCSDRWKIRPSRRVLEALGASGPGAAVITGVRAEEAAHRRRRRAAGDGWLRGLREQAAGGAAYAPLLGWSTRDVWAYISATGEPAWRSPGWDALRRIYAATPQGRMGCWACTLVAEDRAWRGLHAAGLAPGYPRLEAWKQLWLHMSRGNPGHWRLRRRSCGRLRYCYGKLRPEARLVLGWALQAAARGAPELEPLKPRIEKALRDLVEAENPGPGEACMMLHEDPAAESLARKTGLTSCPYRAR